MIKKKIIGIPGYKISDDVGFGAGINHLEFISKFGNARIIMPWEEYVDVDMLYLPGGLDLDPMDYGEIPGYATSHTDVHKEFFFKHRLHKYVAKKIPIFGVCLGMQQLGVMFGSKMTQNTDFHAQSTDRWQEAHPVFDYEMLAKAVDEEDLEDIGFSVNSHHHQYIGDLDLGEDLKALYVSTNEDFQKDISTSPYIVEMFKHNTLPIYGVQWHPEELYDSETVEIIKDLLSNKKK